MRWKVPDRLRTRCGWWWSERWRIRSGSSWSAYAASRRACSRSCSPAWHTSCCADRRAARLPGSAPIPPRRIRAQWTCGHECQSSNLVAHRTADLTPVRLKFGGSLCLPVEKASVWTFLGHHFCSVCRPDPQAPHFWDRAPRAVKGIEEESSGWLSSDARCWFTIRPTLELRLTQTSYVRT